MTTQFAASKLNPSSHVRDERYGTFTMSPQSCSDGCQTGIKMVKPQQRGRWMIPSILVVVLLMGQVCIAFTISCPLYAFQSLKPRHSQVFPQPPEPEQIELIELPLPPVAPDNGPGSCTLEINPRGTGCIPRELDASKFQGGDFTPDGKHVIITVNFVGAREESKLASFHSGEQLVLVKVDGTTFEEGDAWKCLTCGVFSEYMDNSTAYPHVFRSGQKALWGRNIVDCDGHQLTSDKCTSEKIHIRAIYWPTVTNGLESDGTIRELRLHPDDVHLGFNSFDGAGGQNGFVGRLVFNSTAKRYDLKSVNLLYDPTRSQQITARDGELILHNDVIRVGELRGFSGTGDEVLYVGPSQEANNIDIFSVHVVTGVVRRLTQHPEYADPVAFSTDNNWMIVMDTRGSNRQMFMSGMRHVPPLIDLVTITAAASTRNNGDRRFFQPYLIDKHGDRGMYFGQQINGQNSNSTTNDQNWNGRADPAFSYDGTKIVYWQAIVKGRECGGDNPLPCPVPSTQGRREYRLMLARLIDRKPTAVPPVFDIPDTLPWATPFGPSSSLPKSTNVEPGSFTLRGSISGIAKVQLVGSANGIDAVSMNYVDFVDIEGYVLNGWENVTRTIQYPNVWANVLDWYSEIEQTGCVNATKRTSKGGFHLQIDAMTNIFAAQGTLNTTINGVLYVQPANST